MEEVKDNEISKFMADIEKYKEFWEDIEVIVVAVRSKKKNAWVNLVTKAQLHLFAADIDRTTGMPFRVNDDLVVIREFFFHFKNIKQLIEDLKRGTLKICGWQILYNNVTWDFKVRRREPFNQYNKEWKALKLEGIGSKSIFELIPSEEDLISKLRYEGKYETIRELIWNFTRYEGKMCYIEIVAPIYIKMGWRIEEDKCLIECSAHNSVNLRDLELSWRVKKDNEVLDRGKKLFFKSEKVEENKQFSKFKDSIKISNSDSVGYRLFYKRGEIDEGEIAIHKEEAIESRDVTERVSSREQIEKKAVEKLDINKMPGKYENRVFIGGNYDHMAVLKEIEKYIKKSGFQPILAYDFDVPKNKIHDFDLRLLQNCKYAIFDETHPAGELMEIERTKDYGTIVLIIYQIRDPENIEPPAQVTSMVTSLDYPMKGYNTFDELKNIITTWLSDVRKNKT